MKPSNLVAAAALALAASTPLCCWAQQTVVAVPPPPPLPSSLPQVQAYSACVMNCDTTAGACQGACSINNSPSITFARSPGTSSSVSTAPADTLTRCNLSCTSQQLSCKSRCKPPF